MENKQLLEIQTEYLSKKNPIYRNQYKEYFESSLKTDLIIVIEGQRRVGKSSFIISHLKKNKIDLKKVFYFNKETDISENIKNNLDLKELFDEFVKQNGKPEYIIIDEIQNIENWENFIREYYAIGGYKIIITGSNSKLLSGELATYLTGRYISLNMFPLSYNEFLDFKGYERGNESFKEYVEFGGMPGISFVGIETREDYLKSLLNSIVFKDVVDRYKIRDIGLLMKVLAYLSNNVGFLISITNISNYLKNQLKEGYSIQTIANYLNYLETSYLVNEVKKYDLKGKKILEYTGKYYFTDVGLRNSFGYNYFNDIGKILENLVYIKLKQNGYDVCVGYYDDLEIDFVGEKRGEKIYIQVCYLISTKEIGDREFGNLLKIQDNYRKIVLSMDDVFGNTYEGIEHINIVKWLTT